MNSNIVCLQIEHPILSVKALVYRFDEDRAIQVCFIELMHNQIVMNTNVHEIAQIPQPALEAALHYITLLTQLGYTVVKNN